MKIVITSTGETFESEVDPRFGRCAYFIIVDTDTMDFEVVPNRFRDVPHGAGIQAAQFVIGRGVNKVLSGDFGPNSEGILASAGVEMIRVPPGTKVRDAIEMAKGEVHPPTTPPRRAEPIHHHHTPPVYEIHSLKEELDNLKREIEEIKNLLRDIKDNR